MKNVRLTKTMREDILSSYIKKWEEVNKEPVYTSENVVEPALAESIRLQIIGDIDLSTIPENFLNVESSIKVDTPDGYRYMYFRDSGNHITMKLLPRMDGAFSLTATSKLYTDYKIAKRALQEKNKLHDEWCGKKRNVMRDVRTVLFAVSSTKQLLENWPEAASFLPKSVSTPAKVNFPTVSISDLNKEINV